MIYSIIKRIKDYVKVRIYRFNKHDDVNNSGHNKKSDDDTSKYELRKWHYESGLIKAETFYVDGKLDGIANYYYENGNLKAREFYHDDQLTGLSKWYYESGEVKSERYYKDGVLTSRREFDKLGRVIRTSLSD
ncbi:MAG: hypothetical protein WCJ01_09325 [Ignavibacteria bacterium]